MTRRALAIRLVQGCVQLCAWLARLVVRASAWLVPRTGPAEAGPSTSSLRARWREEWLAEIDRAPDDGRSPMGVALRALGAPVDALVMRWIHRRRWLTRALPADLRYAFRSLLGARWFTIGAALTFALGIGVNLAVFSAVDRILFRPLPFDEPDRLMLLRRCHPPGGCSAGSFPDAFPELARDGLQHLGELTLVGLTSGYPVTATPGGVPDLELTRAWPNLLRVIGVRPSIGRDISTDEERDEVPVALLSDEAWARRYHRDPEVLGQPVGPGADSPTIIGILPPGFIVPAWGMSNPEWEGIVFRQRVVVIAAISRLRDGSSREAAQDEVTAFVASVAPELRLRREPADAPPPFIQVDPIGSVLFDLWSAHAWLVAAAAGLVLLMACVNLGALLLARGRSREYDVALRTALGASTGRLLGASLIETVVVCAAGSAIALAAVGVTSKALAAVLPPTFARYMAGPTDGRMIAAACLAALVCGLVTGLLPGLAASRTNVSAMLRREGGAGRRTRLRGGRGLLAVESALGVVLVLGAALALRSFVLQATDDEGYVADDLYRVDVVDEPRSPRPEAAAAGSLGEYREVLRLASGLPGVAGVAGADTVMGTGSGYVRPFVADRAIDGMRMEVDAGFFGVAGTPLVAGREFSAEEVRGLAPVAMLNRDGLAQVWPGVSPGEAVGRTLALPGEAPRTVVGIVPRIIKNSRGEDTPPLIYVPLGTQPRSYRTFLVRMTPGTALPAGLLHARVAETLGPMQVRVDAAGARLDERLADPRFRATLFGTFGLCGLLLATAGLYALASFEVSLRRYEMGVRMTLGASRQQILRTVVLGALRPVALGLCAGVVCAVWLGGFLQEYLFRTDARDPWTLAAVALTLITAATAAALRPALHASRTDPTVVLRAS